MVAHDLDERLTSWFATQMQEQGRGGVQVERVFRLSDGHSSVTLGIDVSWSDPSPGRDTFVLRTSPEGVGLLEPYDIAKQFRITADLADSGIPLPAALWLEEGSAVLGRPFFVMSRVEGAIIEYVIPEWMQQATDESRRSMSTQIVETIAALHNVPVDDGGFEYLQGTEDTDSTGRELEWWVEIVEDAKPGPLPAFDALIDWLREHRPAGSGRKTLLHGDLKWGNFVFDRDRLVALLDWEMAAIGDPLVDVGYALMYWDTSPAQLPGGLDRAEFIELYESRTGIMVADVEWYESLNALKLAAILLRGIAMFERGESQDLRYAWMGTAVPYLVNRALARAGIADVEQSPWNPTPARVAEAIEHLLSAGVLPHLPDEARADAGVLTMAVRFLADAAAGTQFDIARAAVDATPHQHK